jgi:hypothetical protein
MEEFTAEAVQGDNIEMANGLGGLLGALLGIAIFATVAGSIIGKGASNVWGGVKGVKPGRSMWW